MTSQITASRLPESEETPVPVNAELGKNTTICGPLHLSQYPKILIVEDDIPLSKFLMRELNLRHFSVEVMHDGEAAFAHLQELAYDLILLDLNLPKMD